MSTADQAQRAVVQTNGVGAERIEVDGHDLTTGVWLIELTARPGEIATLRLDFPLLRGLDYDGNVRVELLPETRDALIALGWTPPPASDQADEAVGPLPVDELLVLVGSHRAAQQWLDEHEIPRDRRRTHVFIMNGSRALTQLRGRSAACRLVELHDAHAVLNEHAWQELRASIALVEATRRQLEPSTPPLTVSGTDLE